MAVSCTSAVVETITLVTLAMLLSFSSLVEFVGSGKHTLSCWVALKSLHYQ